MVLSVQDLSIGRSGQVLRSGLSFSVGAGAVLLLKGPNGAGKTTLLRSLAGLLPTLSGRIQRPEHFRFSGHLDGVKPQLTVTENLSFYRALQGEGDVKDALDVWNLTALATRPASDLSAGQRRRLALAVLSMGFAPLWLLDEPTASLDTASSAIFEAVLARHLAAGGAAVIATHVPIAASGADVLDLAPDPVSAIDLEALW